MVTKNLAVWNVSDFSTPLAESTPVGTTFTVTGNPDGMVFNDGAITEEVPTDMPANTVTDSDQILTGTLQGAAVNGVFEFEAAYQVTDGTNIINVYRIDNDITGGTTVAYVADAQLVTGTTYTVLANDVSVNSPNGTAYEATPTYAQLWDICLCRGTLIDTAAGPVLVEDLAAGMMVRTRDNGMQPIRWVGSKKTKDRAVRIKAGALGNTRDLLVSPRHRMVLEGWQLEMLFNHDHALVTALELVNDSTIVMDEMADVEYYHVMFDAHEIIFAEGAATESFHPDQASMGSMDAAAREEIFALFPELKDGSYRAEAAPNLSATQAAYVGKNLDAFVN